MSDPLWYKDAVIYEAHVRAFFDSNNDGIGDFPGLTSRLDYLQSVGINCLWLLPFYPSPLRDDGYDIADYEGIHPSYGTLQDFDRFMEEAHKRDIRVITELVINHTSDQHPWFQAALRAPAGSPERDFYVWSDSKQRYQGVRIIFTDSETSNWSWDDTAKAYYWHRFFHHQPDLNFDNPRVLEAVIRVMQFWLDRGVDGLRLDAVPYLIEREGTICENLWETHEILKSIRRALDARYPDRMLIAEANQWPADVRPYFGDGDECHMAFHFPLMPRMFMAVRQEDRHPITEILRQTPDIPENCQWGLFLRNHDELTLEMVTDEERDYMYQSYGCRSPDADQRRHPPPAGAAHGEQPPAHRADELPALLISGDAGDLLRRRDRHGGQHLPRRSQRRADADAVDQRPQRRILARRSGAPLCRADHGSGLRLSGGERRSAGAIRLFDAALDEAADRPAQTVQGLRTRHAGVPADAESQGDRLPPALRQRAGPLHLESGADAATGRARSVGIRRHDAGGDARPDGVPAHR